MAKYSVKYVDDGTGKEWKVVDAKGNVVENVKTKEHAERIKKALR